MSGRRVIISAFALLLLSVLVTQTDITGRLVKDQSTVSMSSFFAVTGLVFVVLTFFVVYKFVKDDLQN